ncbi:transcription termination factor Rho [Candidatus Vidania fulgoroideorum]
MEGILEIMPNRYGFVRIKSRQYKPHKSDIMVNRDTVLKNRLKNGDWVVIKNEKDIDSQYGYRKDFSCITSTFPKEQIKLGSGVGGKYISNRLIDMLCPIGKGQRGLIVSAPKSGKTLLLKHISYAIKKDHRDIKMIVLLIDERPEEVTDIRGYLDDQEVVSSTFDETPFRHIQLSELILAYAKRQVERGEDVIILMDSITRLARAYNSVLPSYGKTLTGGIDINALTLPKKFLGAARNFKRKGSLTIIGTCLINTGSRMDNIIYEEMKSTGNMEIHLDRNIAYERIYPAINIKLSGTRNEELLLSKKTLGAVRKVRTFLSNVSPVHATRFLIRHIKRSLCNDDLLRRIK